MLLRSSLVFASLLLAGCVKAQPISCNETESLLELDFHPTREDFPYLSWKTLRASNRFSIMGSTIEYGHYYPRESVYYYDEQPSSVGHCIPADECVLLDLRVDMPNEPENPERYVLSSEDFTVRVDGVEIASGPAFPERKYESFSLTEIGPCVPTCADGESLVEISAFTGSSYYLDDGWQIQDVNGQTLLECEDYYGVDSCDEDQNSFLHWDTWNLYFSRKCLPSTGCYQLVAGDSRWSTGNPEYYQYNGTAFNLTVDGDLIASLEDNRYEAVEFGSSCSEAACNANESVLELFMFHSLGQDCPNLTWMIQDANSTLVMDTITWNDTALQYARECVPSDACMTFQLSVPETPHHEEVDFRLSIDGVIFADDRYVCLGNCTSYDGGVHFERTHAIDIGECAASDLCDEASESLLDLQLLTSSTLSPRDDSAYWKVFYRDNIPDWDEDFLSSKGDVFNYFFPETSYRYYECIPKANCTKCAEFAIKTSALEEEEVSSYQVSLDGEVLDDGHACEWTGEYDDRNTYYCDGFTVTPLGECGCSDDVSKGAIAGIAVGGVAALLIIGLVGYKLYHAKKVTPTPGVTAEVDLEAGAEITPQDS